MPILLDDNAEADPLLRAEVLIEAQGGASVRTALPELVAEVKGDSSISLASTTTFLQMTAEVKMESSLTLTQNIFDVGFQPSEEIFSSSIFLRLNDEANLFLETEPAEVICESSIDFGSVITPTFEAEELFSSSIGLELTVAGSYELLITVEMIPALVNRLPFQEYQGRFKVNGEILPFLRASISKASNGIDKTLQLTLARIEDRAKILAEASYTFELNTIKSDGSDDWETLIDSTLTSRAFNVAWSANAPNDTLEMSSKALIGRAFRRAPIGGMVFYDSTKLAVNVTDYQRIYDTLGNYYLPLLVPIPGLTLYDLFHLIFQVQCGFSGYQTNILNYFIKRAEVSRNSTYLETIAGIIGSFEPLIYVDANNKVWVIDTTQPLPVGFPAPRALYCRDYRTFGNQDSYNKLDCLIVKYTPSDSNISTFWLPRTENLTQELGDFGGSTPITSVTINRQWRDYRTFDNPDVIIRTELYSENITKSIGVANVVDVEDILYQFNALQQMTGYAKTIKKLVPDVTNPDADPSLEKVLDEDFIASYGPHPYMPGKTIQTSTRKRTRGLIAIDSTNQQLGKDYKRSFTDVYRAGNLTEDMTTEYGDISVTVTNTQPMPNGMVYVEEYTIDYVSNIVSPVSRSEPRAGDVSVNGNQTQSREVIVWYDGPVLNPLREDFALGEIPPDIGIPLSQRVLIRKNEGDTRANLEVIGRRRDIDIGSQVTAKYRDEVDIGAFLIEGITINIENTGQDSQYVNTILQGIKI